MKRSIESALVRWQSLPQGERLPLLLRGARQVGKSHAVESFGARYFKRCIVINFEFQPTFKDCFDNLDPISIVSLLEAKTGQVIAPGESLLFLDEIQECPQAILALRYFKEKMPALHVIGAGSLLEFVLEAAEFQWPVGRVQCMHLYPLSFKEFLWATQKEKLATFIEEATLTHPLPTVLHEELLQQLRHYFVIGGMPAAVNAFLSTQKLQQTQSMQQTLLSGYRNDFGKYTKKSMYQHLQFIFDRLPHFIAQQTKYVDIAPDLLSRDVKLALHKLSLAGLIYPVYATSAGGLPLHSLINEKKFKLLFVDIGLVTINARLDGDILVDPDFIAINRGMLAEQFVGQELLAVADYFLPRDIFFWARDEKSSRAEVDYVIQVGSRIIPIEVKAGSLRPQRLASLKIFMAEKNSQLGVHLSQQPLQCHGNIISVPLYMVSELERLIAEQFV